MSEEILNAILQLLAIVAMEDEVTADERDSVEHFLLTKLNSETAKKYIRKFDEYVRDQKLNGGDQKRIKEICNQINREQTTQQKAIIILELIVLIASDGNITPREKELLYMIADCINIQKNIVDLIKAFAIFQDRTKINSRNILLVDAGTHELPEKCKHIVRETLHGFIMVLRVPDAEIYLVKYVGNSLIKINDAPAVVNQIYTLPLGSSIKSNDISPIYYSELINQFRETEKDHEITFVAENITFKFKNGNIGLRNINIQEESGKLIALMGGSGAGKSTLLNVLNGNEQPSEGSVRINGIDIHASRKKIEGVIGYVPQDDLLMEDLTVFDNLYYAAKLCFKGLNETGLNTLVSRTLEDLGLVETKNLKVGSPLEKTISGGQRKRLNIGLELLRQPSVLFVDEPTSGLSSRDSENIMDLLKELSLKGKMIFVVIHQPSEDIFRMFDKLIILDVGGYQIYYGNPIEGISYFKNLVKMVDHSKSNNPEQIFSIIETKVVNEYGNLTKERKVTPYQWFKHFQDSTSLKTVKESPVVPHKTMDIPGRIKQLSIFSIRDLKSKLSNKQYMLINLLEAPALALLLAFIVRYIPENNQVYSFKENINIPVFFFMSVIVALFMGLTVSAEEIIKDRKILKRESFLNLSRFSYIISKVLILFAISGFQTFSFILIGNLILGIQGMTISFWLVLFSVSCFANALGLNISSGFKSAVTVYILIPLLVIPQLILSGVVVNFDKLNPIITSDDKVPVIGEIMASRWAFEALTVHQFKANAFESNFYDEEKIMAQSEFKSSYLLPRLKNDLEIINNEKHPLEERIERQTILHNELSKELNDLGKDKFPEIDQLVPDAEWSPALYEPTKLFLDKLVGYYNELYKQASNDKQAKMKDMTSGAGKMEAFNTLKQENANDAVSALVKNLTTEHRILESNNEYIQKVYPIFNDPINASNALDFRAQFYQPTKQIGGQLIDTLVFNLAIIWLMTIVLLVALYFDLLKRFLKLF